MSLQILSSYLRIWEPIEKVNNADTNALGNSVIPQWVLHYLLLYLLLCRSYLCKRGHSELYSINNYVIRIISHSHFKPENSAQNWTSGFYGYPEFQPLIWVFEKSRMKQRRKVTWTLMLICCQNEVTEKKVKKANFSLDESLLPHLSHVQWVSYQCVSISSLIALAVSLDRDGIKFGLGDDGNLSVEVDTENIN